MTTIDILTTTIRPEMVELCQWLWLRQECDAQVSHIFAWDRSESRLKALRHLVARSAADFFMLADDDDYVGPGYLQRCLDNIGDAPYYGEIPERAYLMAGAYGVSRQRKRLFQTFTLYRRGYYPFQGERTGPHTTDLIVMRGMMDDPSTAITERKNRYDSKHWPELDTDYDKLKEWLADDPEALERYMRFAW